MTKTESIKRKMNRKIQLTVVTQRVRVLLEEVGRIGGDEEDEEEEREEALLLR